MVIRKSSIILLATWLVTGCSNYSFESPRDENPNAFPATLTASKELANKAVCCTNFRQLKYKDISSDGSISIPLTIDSQTYNFASGKSFVEAYKITSKSRELKIEINSLIYSSVVMPQVTLLDANFNITRTIDGKQFLYKEAKLLKGDRLSASLTIYRLQADNPANETYILFHTTPQDMIGGTTIIHPAKAFAIAHSTVPPKIPDPIIPHSATGLIELKVESRDASTEDKNGYNPLLSIFKPEEKSISEQENAYNREILAAVANNENNRALTLVHEAEAIGSTTARTTFTNALKTRNEAGTHSAQEYNQEIINAVAENEISKALAVVDLAEAAGSTTARQTFIDALDNKTPAQPIIKKVDVDQQIRDAVANKQTSKALELVNKAEAEGSTTARETFVEALKERGK